MPAGVADGWRWRGGPLVSGSGGGWRCVPAGVADGWRWRGARW